MAITIKNNTDKLQNLKNKVNALPDKEAGGGTIVLDLTTVTPADVLANKTYYSADADGQPVKSTGEMNNLGEINVEVGLDGTGQNTNYGYVTGATATFSEEVNNEIDTQADLIAQIKSVLNNKIASSGDEALKGVLDGSVTEIVIPEGTTSIKRYTFDNCTSLKTVVVPNSVTNIGEYAFNKCTSLESIEIPNSVTSIESNAFRDCSKLTNIEIPSSVTSIGGYTFYNCTSLTSIEFSENILRLESAVCSGCTSLASVILGPNVGFVGMQVFMGCTSLNYLIIPTDVWSIGYQALQIGSSDNKATIRFEGITPPTISADTFDISKLDKIEVPMSALDTYKSATNWSNFADYIVGY